MKKQKNNHSKTYMHNIRSPYLAGSHSLD